MTIREMNQISIDFSDAKTGSGAYASVQNATDGKGIKKTYGPTTDCDVQKEMGRTITYTNQLKEDGKTVQEEASNQQMLASGEKIAQCLTGEDVKEIEKEETPLEEYTSTQLDRTIDRVKEQRRESRDAIDSQVEKKQEKRNSVEKSAVRQSLGNDVNPAVIDQIADSNLPLTKENVVRLSGACDMTSAVNGLSFDGIKNLAGSNVPITPQNINLASGAKEVASDVNNSSSSTNASNLAAEDSFEEILPQVMSLLENAGMSDDENVDQHIQVAKELYEADMPVTANSIKRFEQIEELKDIDPEILVDRIVDAMVDGSSPEDANLVTISRKEAKQKIEHFYEKNPITAKRQLEESRLKLTIDAARKLYDKGIDIDTTELSKVVDELRELEKENCEKLLTESGVAATPEHIELVQQTFSYIEELKYTPAAVLGQTITEGMQQTVPELVDAGKALAETVQRVGEEYEKVGTEVRTDLGDSIKKAFQNVDDILESLSLPTSTYNERAVRILAYNHMEITADSVAKVREYDASVNTMMSAMKPAVVAKMVEQQMNPMNMSMDELTAQAEQISADVEINDVSFQKYLWKLDKKGDITAEERSSMVGVFRLFDKVQKSDGAVVGQLVAEGREITMDSLLSAVRTQKAKGMDRVVDDENGGLEEVIPQGESISDQIQSAFSKKAFQDFKETLLDEEEEVVYYEKKADDIRTILTDSEPAIHFLQDMEMPDTIANIAMAKNFLENASDEMMDTWSKEQTENVIDSMDSQDNLVEALENMDESMTTAWEQEASSESITEQRMQQLQFMSEKIRFYGELRKKEYYEIPLETEDGVTTLNITMNRNGNSEDSGTVQIQWDGVLATFGVKEDTITGFLTTENQEEKSKWEQELDDVRETLQSMGYEVKSMTVAAGSRGKPKIQASDRQSGNASKLYQVAKTFIRQLARMEDSL